MQAKKFLVNDKMAVFFVQETCLLSVISDVTNNKSELGKTVRLTCFQNPQLQSVLIFFKFVHLCFLQLHIPSYNVTSSYFYVSLNFVAVPTG